MIKNAVVAKCAHCDKTILAAPDLGWSPLPLEHHLDGSHTMPGLELTPLHFRADSDDGSETHEEHA